MAVVLGVLNPVSVLECCSQKLLPLQDCQPGKSLLGGLPDQAQGEWLRRRQRQGGAPISAPQVCQLVIAQVAMQS